MIGRTVFQLSLLLAFIIVHVSCSSKDKLKHSNKKWLSRRVFDESGEEKLFGNFDRDRVTHSYASHMIDYFVKNPVTLRETECFNKAFTDGTIDFVLDLAPSPSLDDEDYMSANSPIGQYLELFRVDRSPTRSYFDFITKFIDIVSYGVKPDLCHSVIVEKGENLSKFYIRGRSVNESFDLSKIGGDFSDVVRNLKTLWPVSTNSKPETRLAKILVNNLGRMTKLALWNRDNGLPTVLSSKRHLSPIFTIIISDGSSGLSIKDLLDVDSGADLSRTVVLDLGNHRFVDRLAWDEVVRLRSLFTLTSPQTLPAMANSVRTMACMVGSNFKPSQQQQREEKKPELERS